MKKIRTDRLEVSSTTRGLVLAWNPWIVGGGKQSIFRFRTEGQNLYFYNFQRSEIRIRELLCVFPVDVSVVFLCGCLHASALDCVCVICELCVDQ